MNLAYYCKRLAGHWAVFGQDLRQHTPGNEAGCVPWLVAQCIAYTEKRGMVSEGIYRLSGHFAVIQELKERFNTGHDVDLLGSVSDVNVVAGLLKQYLRELKEPLLTFALYHEWVVAARMQGSPHQLTEVDRLVKSLPLVNAHAIRSLVNHLGRVSEHADVNKMNVENLAVVFGPNLLKPKENESATIATDSRAVVQVVALLINHRDTLFSHLCPEADVPLATSSFPAPPGMPAGMDRSRLEAGMGGRLLEQRETVDPLQQSATVRKVSSMLPPPPGPPPPHAPSSHPPHQPPMPPPPVSSPLWAQRPPPPAAQPKVAPGVVLHPAVAELRGSHVSDGAPRGRLSSAEEYREEEPGEDDEDDQEDDVHHEAPGTQPLPPGPPRPLSMTMNPQDQIRSVMMQLSLIRDDMRDLQRQLELEKAKNEALAQRVFELEATQSEY
jgi:hypothetical protein